MPNRPRQDDAGTIHHVTNRGARRDLIFFDDADRRRWLNVLTDVCQRRRVEIHGYCLMGNHFHLLLRTGGNLGEVMRDATSRYVRAFNRRHRLDGPLHKARYFNKPISSDQQFLTTSRYIHRNPLEAGLGAAESFAWSSFRHFVAARRPPAWMTVDFTLALFDHDRDRYRRFVVGAKLSSVRPHRFEPTPDETGEATDLLGVVRVVAAVAQVDADELLSGQPGVRSPGRLAVCLLATGLGFSTAEIAASLGYAGAGAVRRSVGRAGHLLDTDPAFGRLLNTARHALDPAPNSVRAPAA